MSMFAYQARRVRNGFDQPIAVVGASKAEYKAMTGMSSADIKYEVRTGRIRNRRFPSSGIAVVNINRRDLGYCPDMADRRYNVEFTRRYRLAHGPAPLPA